ncbi:hypothetical protein F5Y16DRAFT_420516 [Xylariaceae sp. FL0255]|nr:hypothetical protein F5Y16DRAFT_420516 [Xylariaceae sp. FL0255]
MATTSQPTRTLLGPLTADTWTYTCTEVIQGCDDCDYGWAAQTCTGQSPSDNQQCWPPRTTSVPATSGALGGWGVYSPGFICPGGYTSVAGTTYGISSGFSFEYALSSDETAIGCCPTIVDLTFRGFQPIINANGQQTCVDFQPTTSFLVGSCGADSPVYTPFSIGGTLYSNQFESFSIDAPLFQGVYKASDISSTPSSSPTPGPTPSSSSQGSNTRLSSGAIAGIVIGALLGLIVIATVAFCLWRRRTHRRDAAYQAGSEPNELENAEVAYPVELGATSGPVEMDGGQSPWYHHSTYISSAGEPYKSPSQTTHTSTQAPNATLLYQRV